jgi:hypothetical protein
MKVSVVLSLVIGIAGAVFFVQADAGNAGKEGASCPPSKYADVTDKKVQDMLRGKTLVAAFPEEPAQTKVVQGSKGVTLKISSQDFLVYDAKTGVLQPMRAAVTCSSTCKTSGFGSCSNLGCDATSTGGCSSHSCFGSACDGGSCSKTSTAEVLE